MKRPRYLIALIAILALVVAACGGDGEGSETTEGADTTQPATDTTQPATDTTAGSDEELVIGVSWNNFQQERWAKTDEPNIIRALEEAGARYISADAASSDSQQLTDIENLIAQGANALIILAQDTEAVLPGVQSALDQGIPVIGYDRLIENENALYITFDNVEVGRMQARAIFEEVPEGKYVFIKGNQADPNADFLRGGQQEVLQEAIDSGAIENVGESYTDEWDPAVAQRNMEQILTQNNNEVDAVVASNDGTAGGVVAALEAQGLAGSVPVSGQDGDAAALNRIARGTQTVSVWKDSRELGYAAGQAAVALAQGASLDEIEGTVTFDSPGGNQLTSILLEPIPISRDNLQIVLDADWISVEDLCQGVESGAVDVCP